MRGNKITLPTWRWLNVNYTDINIEDVAIVEYNLRKKNDIIPLNIKEEIDRYQHGFSVEDNSEMELSHNYSCFIHANKNEKHELKNIELACNKENPVLVDSHTIVAEEGSSIELLYDYKNQDKFKSFRHSEIKIIARENSNVKIFYVQRNNEASTVIQSVSCIAYENANVEIVEIEAGASKTYFNFRSHLIGDNSNVEAHAIYVGVKEEYLNLFYNCNQYGKHTNSDIIIKGALKDSASKVFKASLDFKKGSVGSVGNEEETVTLLSEGVHSIAVPLLLCTEDDVVGNHASSAGKIDQDILFYIMSRGISQQEAEKLIVESSIRPTLDRLPDTKIIDEVWDIYERKLAYE